MYTLYNSNTIYNIYIYIYILYVYYIVNCINTSYTNTTNKVGQYLEHNGILCYFKLCLNFLYK